MSLQWWGRPEVGDIVWCLFPHELSKQPGPKPRPALVIKLFQKSDAHFIVSIAYGTSQKIDTLFPGEFLIDHRDGDAWKLSGLSYATKFDLNRTVQLPFNSRWFAPPSEAPFGQTPKLGVLHPSLVKRARAAWEARG